MLNLISNAVKFSEPVTGKIGIRLLVDEGGVQVDITDNGIGISERDQTIIFDEFRQVKNAKRGRPRGTGLGLAITKRIVEFHGGKIWVNSREGAGATFSFHLPAAG